MAARRNKMKTMSVATIATGLLAFTLAGGTADAQAPATQAPATQAVSEGARPSTNGDITGEIELTRAAIQVRRQALVTAAMDLEGREAESFWPLYRDYRLDMAKVNDRYVKLLVAYLEAYDSLTDEAAGRLVDEYLGIERARTGIKTAYVPRFSKIMSAKKVARFFQVDNKLDAVIDAELAQMIPLIR
jgi:hypothetical protein